MVTEFPVHEMFHTFQGEGVHMGRAAFFIRLYGCPVHCPWCDSAGTWHPKFVPKGIQKISSKDLAKTAREHPSETVVITGGEPTIFNLAPLVDDLHKQGLRVHLETSGGFPIDRKRMFDWVTLSPKKWKLPLPEIIDVANEFKVIVEEPDDIKFYYKIIKPHLQDGCDKFIWLHPEWSKRNDKDVLNAIVEVVKSGRSHLFRAGWQIHKLYQADSLDNRSRPLVPLGGNPDKGY